MYLKINVPLKKSHKFTSTSLGRRIRKVGSQIDFPTILTLMLSFHFVCWRELTVQVQVWSARVSNWNFVQPQVTRDFSVKTGIWTPIGMVKKVSETSRPVFNPTVRPDLFQSTHLLDKDTLRGTSSWNSRPAIHFLDYESIKRDLQTRPINECRCVFASVMGE